MDSLYSQRVLRRTIRRVSGPEAEVSSWLLRYAGKGLAQHLQVPLPYLLYRAQVRYEEDLRGLQGLGLRTPSSAFPSVPSPQRVGPAEYFPRIPDSTRPSLPYRDSAHARLGSSSSATGGMASTSGTVPGTSTLRPHIGVRARLSSLGSAHGRALTQLRSPTGTDHVQSPLSANPVGTLYPRPAKKVSSSSTITLQGPKRPRSPQLRPLSPASSRAGSSSDGVNGGEDTSDEEDESDEDARREEEAEKQEILARKLKDLERLMTKDALGLVADPAAMTARVNGSNGTTSRGRPRPLSGMSASLSSSSAPMDYSRSRNQSLSSASVDSPHGSIPSIPSPAAETNGFAQHYGQQHSHRDSHSHTRHHSQGYNAYPNATNMYHRPARSQSQSLSSHSLSHSRSTSNPHSDPQSPPRVSSPMPVARHLGTPEKTSSPPALSPGSARGQTSNVRVQRTPSGLAAGTPTTGSEASSFSDLSGESI